MKVTGVRFWIWPLVFAGLIVLVFCWHPVNCLDYRWGSDWDGLAMVGAPYGGDGQSQSGIWAELKLVQVVVGGVTREEFAWVVVR